MRVGGTVRITADDAGGRELRRARHRGRLGRRPGDAQRPGAGDAARTRTASCGPACSCRRKSTLGAAQPVVALPASAISYAPYGDSVFVVADLKDPKRQDLPRRAAAVREARRRRAATRSRCSRASSRRRGRDLGRVQAAQRRRRPGQQQGAARPTTRRRSRRTADEVHRPLHQAAGPGDRRQPGDPDRRAAVDPRAERAAVPAQRHRGRPGHDGLRRRQRRPGARLHHDAARARDRQRRRHRLHGVVERAGR